MNFQHEPERIYTTDSSGTLLAEVTFPISGNTANITHTFVDSSLRGQGVADKLISAAVDQIRTNQLKVHLTCPYAIKWFEKHPEHSDLL